jgi:hypothetical protein
VVAWCFIIRHLVVAPCIVLCLVAIWYQVGNWALRWGVSVANERY